MEKGSHKAQTSSYKVSKSCVYKVQRGDCSWPHCITEWKVQRVDLEVITRKKYCNYVR